MPSNLISRALFQVWLVDYQWRMENFLAIVISGHTYAAGGYPLRTLVKDADMAVVDRTSPVTSAFRVGDDVYVRLLQFGGNISTILKQMSNEK